MHIFCLRIAISGTVNVMLPLNGQGRYYLNIAMKKISLLLILFVLILTSACSQGKNATSTPILSSGIEGYVTQGPVCPGPVQVGDSSCKDQPYQATITILNPDNSQVTQFQTDNEGYFKFSLNPGTYILRPESGIPMPYASDQTIIVLEGQYTQVSIQYDTGIR
jgi:hypothetical protein